MHVVAAYKLIQSFRSQFDHRGEQLCHFHHFGLSCAQFGVMEVKSVKMAQLLAMMVELTSETLYELVNYHPRHCATLYRSQIHAHLA